MEYKCYKCGKPVKLAGRFYVCKDCGIKYDPNVYLPKRKGNK